MDEEKVDEEKAVNYRFSHNGVKKHILNDFMSFNGDAVDSIIDYCSINRLSIDFCLSYDTTKIQSSLPQSDSSWATTYTDDGTEEDSTMMKSWL